MMMVMVVNILLCFRAEHESRTFAHETEGHKVEGGSVLQQVLFIKCTFDKRIKLY